MRATEWKSLLTAFVAVPSVWATWWELCSVLHRSQLCHAVGTHLQSRLNLSGMCTPSMIDLALRMVGLPSATSANRPAQASVLRLQ